jgi:MerR family transcriptional regulator, thiopeptide resistance regulator
MQAPRDQAEETSVDTRDATEWTVGEVSELAHVSIRALHHYDEIGLLEPSGRTPAGYRLYVEADLDRLHQILLYKELGLGLDTIRRMLDEPSVDRRTELEAQRALLVERRERTEAVIRAVDRMLDTMGKGTKMTTQEMFEGFEDLRNAPDDVRAHHREHAEEAHERWAKTDAYAESMRRARRYAKADWEKIKAEAAAQEEHMAWLMEVGEDPEGEKARAGAEAMRVHIDRWFYPCSHEMHAGLADMYEADARFRRHYDERAEGLARFVARAIRTNATG